MSKEDWIFVLAVLLAFVLLLALSEHGFHPPPTDDKTDVYSMPP